MNNEANTSEMTYIVVDANGNMAHDEALTYFIKEAKAIRRSMRQFQPNRKFFIKPVHHESR